MTDRSPAAVQVVSGGQPVTCTRCGYDGLLAVRVPRGWHTTTGVHTEGSLQWVLCPACDLDRPGAAAIVTFFHVNGRVEDPTTLAEFSRLLQLWITELETAHVDPVAFEADIEAWRNGEFD